MLADRRNRKVTFEAIVTHQWRVRRAALAFLFLTVHLIGGAYAESSQPGRGPGEFPTNAELDQLVNDRDWRKLGAVLSNIPDYPTLIRTMEWERGHVLRGAGMMVGLIYARDLWFLGEKQNLEDPAKDLRVSSAMMTIYLYAMIEIDGLKCADRTAPPNRISQLIGMRRNSLQHLAKKTA